MKRHEFNKGVIKQANSLKYLKVNTQKRGNNGAEINNRVESSTKLNHSLK